RARRSSGRAAGTLGNTNARGSAARPPCPRRGPGLSRPGRCRRPTERAGGRASPRGSLELPSSQRLDPVAQLGRLLEVEPPCRFLHPRLELADPFRELRRRRERLFGGGLHLDRVVVTLVDGLEQLADRRPDRLGRDTVLAVVARLERAAPLRL